MRKMRLPMSARLLLSKKVKSTQQFNYVLSGIIGLGITLIMGSCTTTKLTASKRSAIYAGITATNDSIFKATSVLKIMERVADWQLNHWKVNGFKYRKWDWTNAAGYTGLFALGEISKREDYTKVLLNVGNELNWNTGPRRFLADDYCIGQTYAQLYQKYKEDKMIKPFRLLADSIVKAPFAEPLIWGNMIKLREWAWCDALFMGPTSLAYLSTATGDQRYLDKACKLWWKTTEFLYNKDEKLFFRDSRFFERKEKNGKNVFWSRGNGWVLGGLVRMVDNMPQNYSERRKFVRLYKDMIARIASLQQPDGSWHTSLLDPESYPDKETSGTAFYCYAITWGLKNGILNKSEYFPVAKKAWVALTNSVQADGMLGDVQSIAGAPTAIAKNDTEIYAVGAFLLAGSELYNYLNNIK